MRRDFICAKLIIFICFLFFISEQIYGQNIDYSSYNNLFTTTRNGTSGYKSMTMNEAEKLASFIAEDFGLRKYVRNKIIYEDYSPVTNEQRYCEDSRAAKDILKRSKYPDGVVYALAEFDKKGYFIVFGQYVLNNPTMMAETVVHEMAHIYCVAQGLNQGKDEHSDYFPIIFEKFYEYALNNLEYLFF